MFRKLLMALTCIVSSSVFSCPSATPIGDAYFCSSFKTAATCYCTNAGLPSGMCQDMNQLYFRMLTIYFTLQRACEHQTYTSTIDCMDNWNCYLKGVDSKGTSCLIDHGACQ
jgi:hypothetical protein